MLSRAVMFTPRTYCSSSVVVLLFCVLLLVVVVMSVSFVHAHVVPRTDPVGALGAPVEGQLGSVRIAPADLEVTGRLGRAPGGGWWSGWLVCGRARRGVGWVLGR